MSGQELRAEFEKLLAADTSEKADSQQQPSKNFFWNILATIVGIFAAVAGLCAAIRHFDLMQFLPFHK